MNYHVKVLLIILLIHNNLLAELNHSIESIFDNHPSKIKNLMFDSMKETLESNRLWDDALKEYNQRLLDHAIADNMIMQSGINHEGMILVGIYGFVDGEEINLSMLTDITDGIKLVSNKDMFMQLELANSVESSINLHLIWSQNDNLNRTSEIKTEISPVPRKPQLIGGLRSVHWFDTEKGVDFNDEKFRKGRNFQEVKIQISDLESPQDVELPEYYLVKNNQIVNEYVNWKFVWFYVF